MTGSAHPSSEVLLEFADGRLADQAYDAIAAHVEGCALCQARLDELKPTADELLAALHRLSKTVSASPAVLPEDADSAEPAKQGQQTPPPGSDPEFQAPEGFELVEKIAQGGMGIIWRARDTRLGRYVAIKTLLASKSQRTDLRQRFLDEARLTAQLQHPGIPPVHELGFLPDGRPFLVMKLVRGQTLQQLLQSRTALEDRRPFFLHVLEQVCHTVGYAHSHRVIHRDLKPSNIMVGSHGEVQVMDWGLAKLLDTQPAPAFTLPPSDLTVTAIPEPDSKSLTQAGSVLGTPAYMSPEQAAGQIHLVDTRSDVFGLGAILCQILTGHPPYFGSDVQEIRHKAMHWQIEDAFARLANCSAELDLVSLCRRCLAFRPDDRPNDANVVAEELAGIRQRAEERARRAELQRSEALIRLAESRRRRQMVWAMSAAIISVLLVALVVVFWQMQRAQHAERVARQNEAQARQAELQAFENLQLALAEQEAKEAAWASEKRAHDAARQARDRALETLRLMRYQVIEQHLAREPELSQQQRQFIRSLVERYQLLAQTAQEDVEGLAIRAEGYLEASRLLDLLGDLPAAE